MKASALSAFCFFTAISIFTVPLRAADEHRPRMLFNADVNGNDLQFLSAAVEQGLLQAGLADLAKTHAQSREVKEFSDTLAKQHAAQDGQLRQIAAEKGIPVSTTLTKPQTAVIEKLGKLAGLKFDKAFMEEMTQEQQAFATLFEQNTLSEDAQIKAFAVGTLPAIKQQLALARKIAGIAPRSGTQPHFRTGVAVPGM